MASESAWLSWSILTGERKIDRDSWIQNSLMRITYLSLSPFVFAGLPLLVSLDGDLKMQSMNLMENNRTLARGWGQPRIGPHLSTSLFSVFGKFPDSSLFSVCCLKDSRYLTKYPDQRYDFIRFILPGKFTFSSSAFHLYFPQLNRL